MSDWFYPLVQENQAAAGLFQQHVGWIYSPKMGGIHRQDWEWEYTIRYLATWPVEQQNV